MKRSILLVLFSLVGLTGIAQTAQSIFEWKDDSGIITKKTFFPLSAYSDPGTSDPRCKIYDFQSYTIKNEVGIVYTVKLHSVNTPSPKHGYDGFSIQHKGKNILTYYTGDPLYNFVVSDGKAKVVFDNYAFAYKYTPAPNFSIEFVDDWSGIGEDPDIYKKPSFLHGRTKHKIWREGNVLKYKSWK